MRDYILAILFFGMIFGSMYLAHILDVLTSKIPSDIFMNILTIIIIISSIIAIKKNLQK